MINKVLEVFKTGCTYILEIDGSTITEDIKLLHLMDEFELAEILMYMEEQFECEIDVEISRDKIFLTVEKFVNSVCDVIA